MNYEKVDSVNSTRSVQLRQKKNKTKIEKKTVQFGIGSSSQRVHVRCTG